MTKKTVRFTLIKLMLIRDRCLVQLDPPHEEINLTLSFNVVQQRTQEGSSLIIGVVYKLAGKNGPPSL